MSKTTKERKINDFLQSYDSKSLVAALASLNDGFAWNLITAFLEYKQREYEVIALDLVCHGGKSHEAAKASGYACALEEVRLKYIPEFVEALKGNTGVVEGTRPEDQ